MSEQQGFFFFFSLFLFFASVLQGLVGRPFAQTTGTPGASVGLSKLI